MIGNILVIAAHPDDEVLGCGGTVARLVNQGFRAYTLILGEGFTSRHDKGNTKKNKQGAASLKKQARMANELLGVKDVFHCGLPDNKFDTIPLLAIVKIIEKVKNKIKPSTIFTHYGKDLNIDHQITFKAVMTATRPMPGEVAKEIYLFEVPSSTEWNYPLTFSPNVFFDVGNTIDIKMKALNEYRQELRKYPHPRSLQGVKINAQQWGVKSGLYYAEAFELMRTIK